jgi:hypothetical protein
VKRLKGPELKLSQLKVPDVLKDLYWDLHDRRLLPLVGLAVVAILAVPFLLGAGSKRLPEPGGGGAPIPSAGASEATSLAFVPAEPGLREPSKRLGGRRSKNPFRQHYTGPVLKPGAEPVTESSTPAGGTTPTTGTASGGSSEATPQPSPTPSEPPIGSGGGESGGGGGGSGGNGNGNGDTVPSGGLTYYTFAIDVQVTRTQTNAEGKIEKTAPTTRQGLKPPTVLPGEKAPAVTYIGASAKTRKPLFVISPEVTSVSGEGKCVAGTTSCQLMELEPGFPVTFVYGAASVRYKIDVLKVEPVVTGHS